MFFGTKAPQIPNPKSANDQRTAVVRPHVTHIIHTEPMQYKVLIFRAIFELGDNQIHSIYAHVD